MVMVTIIHLLDDIMAVNQSSSDPPLEEDRASYASISDEASLIFQWINHAVVCQVIDVFGVVFNIINIVCFVKQGFHDPVNVSLLGLAISDLGSLVTLIWLNLAFTPVFQHADLPFDAIEVNHLTAGWPHVVFSRVTSWITALITLERCLCITVPLKVKNIVTPKRVLVIISSVFVVLIGSETPIYCVYGLASKFYPDKNKTLVGMVSTKDRDIVEKVSFPINNVFVPTSAFATVSVSTITLVYELRKKAAWRKTVTADTSSTSLSNRDQKIAKMVVMIAVLFITCYLPSVMNFLAMLLEPQFAIDGKFKSIFLVMFGFCFTLESTNSSMNIFIYYRMSSRYKAVFRQLFRLSDIRE